MGGGPPLPPRGGGKNGVGSGQWLAPVPAIVSEMQYLFFALKRFRAPRNAAERARLGGRGRRGGVASKGTVPVAVLTRPRDGSRRLRDLIEEVKARVPASNQDEGDYVSALNGQGSPSAAGGAGGGGGGKGGGNRPKGTWTRRGVPPRPPRSSLRARKGRSRAGDKKVVCCENSSHCWCQVGDFFLSPGDADTSARPSATGTALRSVGGGTRDGRRGWRCGGLDHLEVLVRACRLLTGAAPRPLSLAGKKNTPRSDLLHWRGVRSGGRRGGAGGPILPVEHLEFTLHHPRAFSPPPASHVPPAPHLAAAAYRFGGLSSETDLGTGPVRASRVFGPDTHNWIACSQSPRSPGPPSQTVSAASPSPGLPLSAPPRPSPPVFESDGHGVSSFGG